MLGKIKDDQNWSGAVILLYTLPFILWVAASSTYMAPSVNWLVFSSGLLFILIGSAALLTMKREPSEITQFKADDSTSEQPTALPFVEIEELQNKLKEQAQEVIKFQDEVTNLKNQNFQVIHAYNGLKKEMEDLQSIPPSQDPEMLRTLESQNETIRQYQEKMIELEDTINDLKYEMSALMNYNNYSEESHLPEEEILKIK